MLKKWSLKIQKITALITFISSKLTTTSTKRTHNSVPTSLARQKEVFAYFVKDRENQIHTIESEMKLLVKVHNQRQRGHIIQSLIKMYKEGTPEDQLKIEIALKKYVTTAKLAHSCFKGIFRNIRFKMSAQDNVDFYLKLRSGKNKEIFLKMVKSRSVLLNIRSNIKNNSEISFIDDILIKLPNSIDFIYSEDY